jgi:hypothetical protein
MRLTLTKDVGTRATPASDHSALRELASRRSGGVSVGLYWRPQGDEIVVRVGDELTGENFVLEPPKQAALDAFYHPYALRDRSGGELRSAESTRTSDRWKERACETSDEQRR